METKSLGSTPPIQETRTEFFSPGFGLAQLQPIVATEGANHWMKEQILSLSLSLFSISLLLFQINNFLSNETLP